MEVVETAGKQVASECITYHPLYAHEGLHVRFQQVIQRRADDGWNFAGVIDRYMATGSVAPDTYTLLFVKGKE